MTVLETCDFLQLKKNVVLFKMERLRRFEILDGYYGRKKTSSKITQEI
jgi:hypothetical protein